MIKTFNILIFLLFSNVLMHSFADSNIDEINSLLKIIPNDSELYFQRGYLFYSHEDYEKASDDFSICIRLQPDEILYHFYKAMTDMKWGKNRVAIDGFNEVVKMKPDHAEAYFYLGILHHRVYENIQAQEAFDNAISLNANVAKYWAARARFKRETGNLQDAIADYENALKIDDNFAIAHYELAWINYENKNIDAALEHAQKVVTLEMSPIYFHTLACIYSEKDLKKAIDNEVKALALDTNPDYESKLAGFKHGQTYSQQEYNEEKIRKNLKQKQEMERIRKEKIWEKIVETNKDLYQSQKRK